MTTNIDTLIIHAHQLVTCASNNMPKRGLAMRDIGMIPDGAVAIHRGQIVDVGMTKDLEARYKPKDVIDATRSVVCPGFIDCHTHIIYGGNRLDEFEQRIMGKPYMQMLAEGGGILSTVRATRQMTQSDLIRSARLRLAIMLRHGTTTAEIKTGYGLNTDTEAKMLSAIIALDQIQPMRIIPTFLGAHAIPPEFKNASAYADYLIAETFPAIYGVYHDSHYDIPLGMDVFCEAGVFDLATTERLLRVAKQDYGMTLKVHTDEFVNLGAVPMAIGLGALSVDHLDVTPSAELDLLAQSDTVGVFLPAVNFHLGNSQYGDARGLIDKGGIVALATDYNPGSAPTPSLPLVMSIACRYQKLHPAEAMNAITINAACALGLERVAGSIETGKQADLVIVDTDDYRTIAYEMGADLISSTIIKGQVVWNRSF